MKTLTYSLVVLLAAVGCSDVEDHDHDHDHDHGVPTTVVLNFTPVDGGAAQSFTWSDPENDGDPIIDSIVLVGAEDGGVSFDLSVEIWNELEEPVEDVTPEIEEEGDTHQLFFTGSGVQGPATGTPPDALLSHTYEDEDDSGLPLGLVNKATTLVQGTAELTVTLRHLPTEDGNATKVSGLAEDVAEGGFAAIAGDSDLQVTFPLEIQ
jgi:hypothetical protein